MNFKKSFILLLVMLFIIAGCSNSGEVNESKSDDQTKEKTLVYGIVGEIQRLDPVLASEKNAFALSSSVFNALVRFPIGTTDVEAIEGDLAEKWESNDDNTQWTFYLREGVQWHQGYGEFTSEDVKYSFERVMDPESGSPYGKDYSHVEKIETPDPYTVVFHLNSQDPNFLLKNITQGGKIVNKEAVEDGKPEIGTGPFMVEKLHTGDRVELVKHPEYFRGEPKLDKVVYKFMKDITAIEIALDIGEIHMAAGLSEPTWIEKTKQKDHIITEFAGLNMVYAYMLDMTTPPFDDIRVRQAIAHAIDVEGYVQNMVGEDAGVIPKGGPIPSDVFGAANVGLYEYDPEKSKKLLAEAGYENGLTLPTQNMSTLPSFLEKALYVQEQLRHAPGAPRS